MNLGAQMESLAEQITASRETRSQLAAQRAESVSALRTGMQQQIQAFRTDRAELVVLMQNELKNGVRQRHNEVRQQLDEAKQHLSHFGSARRAGAVVMMDVLRADAAARAELVKSTLANWDNERRRAGVDLMERLCADRFAWSTALHKELEEFREGLAGTVSLQLAELQGERVRAAKAWASLTRPAEMKEAEPVFAAAADGAAEQSRGADDAQARILAYVNAQPEGVRLTEMAAALNLARVRAGSLARQLIDQGRIRKEDMLYLPAVNGNSEVDRLTEQ